MKTIAAKIANVDATLGIVLTDFFSALKRPKTLSLRTITCASGGRSVEGNLTVSPEEPCCDPIHRFRFVDAVLPWWSVSART